MELWDLLGEDRKPLGRTHIRGKELGSGEYHLVAEIAVTDGHGHVLLTRRYPGKPWGNTWETQGGAVLAGETSLHAAQRELSEETGILLPESAFRLVRSIKGNTTFQDLYFAESDVPIEKIVLQEGETVEARWLDKNEFTELAAQREKCAPSVLRYFDDIVAIL